METKLAYAVNAKSEYRAFDASASIYFAPPEQRYDTRFFALREQAVRYAKELTEATETNGIFAGEWKHNWWREFSGDRQAPNEVRIVATIETVTLDEIEASL